jgi:ZIP family zinc transporter
MPPPSAARLRIDVLGPPGLTLLYFDKAVAGRRRGRFLSVGAAVAAEFNVRTVALSPAQSLSLMIAAHRPPQLLGGLAIGQSAASGEVSLALVLILGFGLHNATEGFGIVGPFSGGHERPSWGFLALVGLVGGGPTFFGTRLGQTWVNEPVSIAFLALAAGSILYRSLNRSADDDTACPRHSEQDFRPSFARGYSRPAAPID